MARTFLISYDLGIPEAPEDYKKIKNYIESYQRWTHPLQSLWLVVSNDKRTGDIRDDLKFLTDKNDKILVINVTGDGWATARMSNQINQWLKNNI